MRPVQVVVAGAQGLLGGALVGHLTEQGHRVRRLVRRPVVSPAEIPWDPAAGRLDAASLEGVDAVVNLGGVGIGDHRWTARYRQEILRSRTSPTGLLARTLASLDTPPRVLLQASAVGFYGDRGDTELDETSPAGTGFLPDVVRAWEAATEPASGHCRVVHLRTGIVLAPRGGALGRLLPILRLGIGGPLGDGRNVWPWITLHDHVRAMAHLLDSPVTGPVNLTAPHPARQGDVVRALSRELHRPAVVPVPRVALRLALGEFADDILSSQRAYPRVLVADGFRFDHARVEGAAAWVTDQAARRR